MAFADAIQQQVVELLIDEGHEVEGIDVHIHTLQSQNTMMTISAMMAHDQHNPPRCVTHQPGVARSTSLTKLLAAADMERTSSTSQPESNATLPSIS